MFPNLGRFNAFCIPLSRTSLHIDAIYQNVREVYNATFQALPEAAKADHDYDVLSYLNQSLDILDLGCGTGLVGSWFKDYGRKIVGVDVSPVMLDMATKKGCYHELRKGVSVSIQLIADATDRRSMKTLV